jgi:hypothetical protein
MKKLITLFAIAGMVLALAPTAQAISWDGGGGDGLWSTAANWSPDTTIAGYAGDLTGGTITHSSETTAVGIIKVRSTSQLIVSGGSLTATGITLDKNAGNLLEASGGTVIVTGLLGRNDGDNSAFMVRQTGSVGSISMGTLGIGNVNSTLDLVMDASGISALTLATANTTANFGNLTIDTSAYEGSGGAITIMNIGTGTQAAFGSVLVDGLGTGFTIAYDGGDGNDVVLTLPGGSTSTPGTLIYGK